ncbi:dTDP-4-dehydrorhamnose 3,5-epimerase [bacterium]|nr:MAG: dTDP-4-dehydrorhamnose 3,5-epimerase [bacterium]
MIIKERKIKGSFDIQLEPHEDKRGFFMRVYDNKIFEEYGINKNWVQENHSLSVKKGTVRGLHFQYPPDAESKMVRVSSGEAFFTFVDLRKKSPTFGQWDNIILSAANKKMLLIPRGCALGMCTLTDNCNLHYRMDNYYAENNQDCITWNDPDIGIDWPIKEAVVISDRDSKAKSFKEFMSISGGLDIE